MKKTSIPGTIFVACPEYEKLRIANHAAILASGFYRRREYLVWDKIVPQYASRCVVLPKFLSEMSREFWIDAAKSGQSMPIEVAERMRVEVDKHAVECPPSDVVTKLEGQWRQVEARYWGILNSLIPDKTRWIKSIEVRVTKYATQATFYLLEKKRSQHLIVHLREDGDAAQLARTLILALLWPDRDAMGLTWSKRMAVADYWMAISPMVKILGRMQPTQNREMISEVWRQRSESYITALGAPQARLPIDTMRQNIQIFGDKEREICLRIVGAAGESVSYDEIADLQWGKGDFGSFWAMNKIVQRIRKKLSMIGIDGSKLLTVRGYGYRWVG